MSEYQDAVTEWLSRLDELQPADGRFAEDVLTVAGAFPVDRPPGDAFDNRNDPVKAYQYDIGTEALAFAAEMARHRRKMAMAKAAEASGDAAAGYRLNAHYWSEISAWLETFL
jgi:hypothetical protein